MTWLDAWRADIADGIDDQQARGEISGEQADWARTRHGL